LRRNTRLWKACYSVASSGSETPTNPCHRISNVNRACSLYPVHLAKTTRMSLQDSLALRNYSGFHVSRMVTVTDSSRLSQDLSLVYLVRDPRGTLLSRSQVDWCQGPCEDPIEMCRQLEEDARVLMADPSVIAVRYEDLVKISSVIQTGNKLNLGHGYLFASLEPPGQIAFAHDGASANICEAAHLRGGHAICAQHIQEFQRSSFCLDEDHR